MVLRRYHIDNVEKCYGHIVWEMEILKPFEQSVTALPQLARIIAWGVGRIVMDFQHDSSTLEPPP